MELPAILAFAIPAVFILVMAFVVPRRLTHRILSVFDRVNRSGDRIFVNLFALLVLVAIFAGGFTVIRMFPFLGTIIVVTSAIGAMIRAGRFLGTFRQAAEDYSASVRNQLR